MESDNKFVIAVGTSRKDTAWKNKPVTWPQLCERLSKSKEIKFSHAEYMNKDKTEQDNIKDIGGFVGAELIENGRRRKDNVKERTLLTLDLDNATDDCLENFAVDAGFTYCIYSTLKHTPEKPRLRLIAPFARPVSVEEYEAIARKIADDLDALEMCDPTTYDLNRLMYWPAHCSDVESVFENVKGSPIDPDEVLESYSDWHDVTSWPIAKTEKPLSTYKGKKQADPLEKTGYIGAFCRAYTIQDAIEKFIPDVYEPSGEDRYTYKEGSTTGGAIVYEDKFIYSHHATDPASGQLCNAYDMVRIHKRLSDDAMKRLCMNDSLVKAQMYKDNIKAAENDFNGVSEGAESDSPDSDVTEDKKTNFGELINLSDVAGHIPERKPVLIDGVLRRGHKMILNAPSKAGKSFALIELSIAIASGGEWLGCKCSTGRVMYMNFELDSADCLNRYKDIFDKLFSDFKDSSKLENIEKNISVWNLRGVNESMDVLTPEIIKRCKDGGYSCIIIDPLYKVMNGDENKPDTVAATASCFDEIATKTGAAVVYSHHFAKGDSSEKNAIDKGSGSGVLARDPDAILNIQPLEEITNDKRPAFELEFAALRSFKEKDSIRLWFDYPLHIVDTSGELDGLKVASKETRKESETDKQNKKILSDAFQSCIDNGTATRFEDGTWAVAVKNLAAACKVEMTDDKARRWLKKYKYREMKMTKDHNMSVFMRPESEKQ